jgi:hypothetical protein
MTTLILLTAVDPDLDAGLFFFGGLASIVAGLVVYMLLTLLTR